MPQPARRLFAAAFCAAGLLAPLTLGSSPALAQPDQTPSDPAAVGAPPIGVQPPPPGPFPFPPPADPFAPPASIQPAAAPAPDPLPPFVGQPPFAPPSFDPPNGAKVGVAKPIVIKFQSPIEDRPLAESAIRISPAVPGKFYWMNDKQLRWRPIDFWPANTPVTVDAAGARSSFTTGDALVATVDDKTHQMEIMRNGKLEKTFPVSMGKKGYETPNGTYYASEEFADMWMDSSTYGVPIDSPEGYRLKVLDAVRISNTGIFVHGAPWSVSDQGKRNVSHGCINLSPANAQWFFDNFGSGDPVVVKNPGGGLYNQNDGYDDWQR
jgi:lipoprotein-anchoring transpeptidase ErfK/SrfK